jgi:hypothetical protein
MFAQKAEVTLYKNAITDLMMHRQQVGDTSAVYVNISDLSYSMGEIGYKAEEIIPESLDGIKTFRQKDRKSVWPDKKIIVSELKILYPEISDKSVTFNILLQLTKRIKRNQYKSESDVLYKVMYRYNCDIKRYVLSKIDEIDPETKRIQKVNVYEKRVEG